MNGDPHPESGPTPGGPASPPPRSKVPYIIAAIVALGLLNYALQSGPGPLFGGGGGGGGGHGGDGQSGGGGGQSGGGDSGGGGGQSGGGDSGGDGGGGGGGGGGGDMPYRDEEIPF